MFQLITYTDASGNQHHVYVPVVAGQGSVAKAITKLMQGGIPQENITQRGTFNSIDAIKGDDRFSSATSIDDFASGTGGASGAGGDDGNDFDDVSDTGEVSEAFDFRPGFETALRQGGIDIGGGGGVLGARANQAFNPLLGRATINAALNSPASAFDPNATQEDLVGNTFQKFISDQIAGNSLLGQGGAQAARGLLEQARNVNTNATPISGQFLNPATVGQGSSLANVAREAGRQRFGSFARFLPQASQLANSFLSQQNVPNVSFDEQGNQVNTPLSFANFLNQKIFG